MSEENKNVKPRKSSLAKGFWFVVITAVIVWVAASHVFERDYSPVKSESHSDFYNEIRNVAKVKPTEPDSDQVEALRRQREEELRRELERAQFELGKVRYMTELEVRYAKYRKDVAALVEQYRKELPLADGEKEFQKAEDGAKFLASKEGLCGYKALASLAYKMADDKIKHTKRVEEALEPLVASHFKEPINNSIIVYEKWMEKFDAALIAETQVFNTDIVSQTSKFIDELSVLSIPEAKALDKSLEEFRDKMRDLAKTSISAGIGTVVEVALIKMSYVAIKKLVVKIAMASCAPIAKKMAGSVAVAGASAVVDGPLPFGDIAGGIVAIGGAIWTGRDIYKVTKSMPEELKQSLLTAIHDARQGLLDKAEENLKRGSEACLKAAEERVKEQTQKLQ